jgi:hypothetical protein
MRPKNDIKTACYCLRRSRVSGSREEEAGKMSIATHEHGGRKFRILELKRTLDLGYHAGRTDIAVSRFVIRIYKDMEAPRRYLPVVFQRGRFRLKPSFVKTMADEDIEIEDRTYNPELFARPTESQAVKAILDRITADFGPTFQRQKPRGRSKDKS